MPDRNQVIEGLEWVLEDDRFGFGINWTENSEPKSDEERAGYNIQMAIALLKKQPEIVRCKDCKHGEKVPTFKYYPDVTWCNKYLTSHNDDWFCDDGKRS